MCSKIIPINMEKNEYLKLQSEFINQFDIDWRKDINQIDIFAQLEKIEFNDGINAKEYFSVNANKQTVKNYIVSISNQINLYSVNILKLEKWNSLFEKNKPDYEKEFILQDRLIPLATLLLTEPNVLKNRIIFFFLTILDEKFEFSEIESKYWLSDFFDKQKYVLKAQEFNYNLINARDILAKVNSEETKKFRDHYTHKIAPNIAYGGYTEFKTVTNGSLSAVGFGVIPPITVDEIITLANKENENILQSFQELMIFLKLH